MKTFNQAFSDCVEKADRVLLCGHVRPDGDAIGASMAMAYYLRSLGKRPTLYFEGDLSHYPWLFDGCDLPFLTTLSELNDYIRSRYAFMMLDLANPERAGEARIAFDKAEDTIVIDHHVRMGEYANANRIEPRATSTCEIVCDLFGEIGAEITPPMAAALLTGIAFDTGGFRHSNMTAKTFTIAAELVSKGAPVTPILNGLFHTKTFTEQRMLGMILSGAKLYHQGRVVMSVVTQADCLRMGASANDCESAVSALSETAGVEVAVFLRELPPKEGQPGTQPQIRVNLRSKHVVDVSRVAAAFGGGGHIRASGATIVEPLLIAQRMVLDEIAKQLPEG